MSGDCHRICLLHAAAVLCSPFAGQHQSRSYSWINVLTTNNPSLYPSYICNPVTYMWHWQRRKVLAVYQECGTRSRAVIQGRARNRWRTTRSQHGRRVCLLRGSGQPTEGLPLSHCQARSLQKPTVSVRCSSVVLESGTHVRNVPVLAGQYPPLWTLAGSNVAGQVSQEPVIHKIAEVNEYILWYSVYSVIIVIIVLCFIRCKVWFW